MAAVGGLVTLAVIAVVLWEALQPPSPPVLHARIVEVRPTAHGFLAEVEVLNDGADTAAAVDVLGQLNDASATATVDYVPGRGRATVWLRFDRDPGLAKVDIVGWSEP
jgi:uncharacterized protein (TIGR02588 family)